MERSNVLTTIITIGKNNGLKLLI